MINNNVAIRKLLINTLLVSVLDGGKGSDEQKTFIRKDAVLCIIKKIVVK